ncbi:uncharacterized protein SOCEGT47_044590 [Sorangium cellulosum]|jgi:hypothetical protein|uniref:DUF4180 domain-containing protein n=1 Tax=Sorangium cellulosum TaxID=56 RepID=A0A4P2Q3Q8_SORCE|nr:DUF4180 domain-containing protein [Sorangium cellulosum]AUX23929.1 uncharacterized protein SOCEGT47_044590 [Sorangium cellulosum]
MAATDLTVADESGAKFVEGPPGQGFLSRVRDADRVLEACFAARVRCALLYAENLTAAFFDLSSGEAGAILQKLRNYRIRLAVVCPPGSVEFSSRFGELLAEERRGDHFGVFETREAATEWIRLTSEADAI